MLAAGGIVSTAKPATYLRQHVKDDQDDTEDGFPPIHQEQIPHRTHSGVGQRVMASEQRHDPASCEPGSADNA